MWVLDCDGTIFANKRLWLSPGTRHVLGRTRSHPDNDTEGAFHGIDNKSVSRKHIVLSVDSISPGASSRLSEKSRLTLEDCSKIGTWLDDERIANSSPVVLHKHEHFIKLGNWENRLHVIWVPVSLALAHISKSKKNFESEIQSIRKQLEPFDIKVTADFHVGSTTHVVASKRNVSSTLESLVHASFIVTPPFIDALAEAATSRRSPGQNTQQAYLEKDFDLYWPNPLQYVPAAGKEPIPRSADMYAPNDARQNVFSRFTFVFCLENQMNNLQSPITGGGGKALLYSEFNQGTTKPEDFVRYVKKIGGNKRGQQASNGHDGACVVVVRLPGEDPWVASFVQNTDLLLGQRSVLQNEFLDPILLNDASKLQQPLEEEDVPSSVVLSSVPPSVPVSQVRSPSRLEAEPPRQQTVLVPSSAPELNEKPLSKARRLRLGRVKSKFKGFDDFEPKIEDAASLGGIPEEDIVMHDSIDQVSPINENEQPAEAMQRLELSTAQEQRPGKKRAIGQAGLEDILPAAAEVKRRRIQAGLDKASQDNSQLVEEVKVKPKVPTQVFRRTIIKGTRSGAAEGDDLDLMNAVRAQREYEEEQAKIEEEALQKPMNNEEMSHVRDLISYGEIKVGKAHKNHVEAGRNDRWDDRWNGRQNFKKFKRKGDGPQPIRGSRVIVALEPARKNDNPLGSVRWATTGSASRDSASRSHHRSHFDGEDEDESQFRRRGMSQRNLNGELAQALQVPDYGEEEVVSKDLDDLPPQVQQLMETPTTYESTVPTTQPPTVQSQSRSKKRPADTSNDPPPKRQARRSRLAGMDQDENDASEGSEEELRFKFSSRRKRV